MMGAGKSAVGRALAATSGREFLDTDLMIQHKLGRSIGQLFTIYGEAAFRDHETCILRELEPSFSVLSTGGGIVVRDDNWAELQRLGTTVYLDTPIEVLIARLEASKKKRPLLQIEDWPSRLRALLEERSERYEKADVHVRVETEDIEAVSQQVLAALEAAG